MHDNCKDRLLYSITAMQSRTKIHLILSTAEENERKLSDDFTLVTDIQHNNEEMQYFPHFNSTISCFSEFNSLRRHSSSLLYCHKIIKLMVLYASSSHLYSLSKMLQHHITGYWKWLSQLYALPHLIHNVSPNKRILLNSENWNNIKE